MQPYDRPHPYTFAPPSIRTEAGAVSLSERVMLLVALTFLAAVVGTALGAHGLNDASARSGQILWILAEFGALIATMVLAERAIAGPACLLGFGTLTGIAIAPLLHQMALRGQGDVVVEALAATGAVTLALTLYARTTTRDFSGMGGYLLAGLVGVIVMSILGAILRSSVIGTVVSMAATVIFSLFLVYDVQRITTSANTRGNAVRLALSVYLDILNLFLNLLNLLSRR